MEGAGRGREGGKGICVGFERQDLLTKIGFIAKF